MFKPGRNKKPVQLLGDEGETALRQRERVGDSKKSENEIGNFRERKETHERNGLFRKVRDIREKEREIGGTQMRQWSKFKPKQIYKDL